MIAIFNRRCLQGRCPSRRLVLAAPPPTRDRAAGWIARRVTACSPDTHACAIRHITITSQMHLHITNSLFFYAQTPRPSFAYICNSTTHPPNPPYVPLTACTYLCKLAIIPFDGLALSAHLFAFFCHFQLLLSFLAFFSFSYEFSFVVISFSFHSISSSITMSYSMLWSTRTPLYVDLQIQNRLMTAQCSVG